LKDSEEFRSQNYELYEGDGVVHYTLLDVEHPFLQMRAVIWVISFPEDNCFVFTDCLN
jgi:hypothetical protein